MTTRSAVVLVIAAAALGGAAVWLSGDRRPSAQKLNGRALIPSLVIEDVAAVECGETFKVERGDEGFTVTTYHGYPADRAKLAAALLRLAELKVGQVVRGKALDAARTLVLRDGAGREVGGFRLGPRHANYQRGRYAACAGETVLVSDPLEFLDGDGRDLVERKIVDEPWISFSDIVEGVAEEELGLATGAVVRVTVAGDTNRLARVGAKVKEGGSERYFRLEGSPWTFTVPGYAVEPLLGGGEEAAAAPSSPQE